jgi:hypothetical protein
MTKTKEASFHHRRSQRRPSTTVPQALTIERVERGLAVLAHIMSMRDEDGSKYAPLYEKLEQELETLRRQQDTVARAKRLLESYGGRPRLALAPPIDGEVDDNPDAVFTALSPN